MEACEKSPNVRECHGSHSAFDFPFVFERVDSQALIVN